MKKTRKIVIVITAVLVVAGIAAVVTGTVIKKDISAAEYKDASAIEAADIGKRYSVKLDTDSIYENADGLCCYQIDFPDV